MSFNWEDQPEASGPMAEPPEPGQPRQHGWRPGPARPLRDPAAEAAERNLAAERAADLGKTAPPDALEIS